MQRFLKNKKFVVLVFPLIYMFLIGNSQNSQDRIYLGEKVCRACHHLQGNRDQYNPWRMSKHADAYAALFKPEAKQIAELSGIDIEPFKSPVCLGCHTTAYNEEDWERDPSFHFEDGVQCEQCHGPGSDYIDPEAMYIKEKAIQAGLKIPEKRDCMICHKEKNSHVTVLDSKIFIYEEGLQAIKHHGIGGGYFLELIEQPNPISGPKYVGSLVWAECHGSYANERIYSKWYRSKHARAYASLSGDKANKIATEMGISETSQKSEICLKCHVTGAGQLP